MSEVIQIPDGKTAFQIAGGSTFRLSCIEAMRAYSRIADESKAAGHSNFEHVEKFAGWVKEATGVDLNIDQADYLIDRINCEYAKAKNEVRALLNLPNSTGPASGS